MNDRFSRLQLSPSARALDYPVIDTDVHVNDYTPDLEDYVSSYGGMHLVDALRKASEDRIARGGVGNGKV